MNFSTEDFALIALLLDEEKKERKNKTLGSFYMDVSRHRKRICNIV